MGVQPVENPLGFFYWVKAARARYLTGCLRLAALRGKLMEVYHVCARRRPARGIFMIP